MRSQPRSMIAVEIAGCPGDPDHISLQYVDAMMRFVVVCN